MGVRFTNKPDFNKFDIKQDVERLMKQIVIDGVAEIKTRTARQGIDAFGKPFKPYSKAYQAFKSRRTKSNAKPNLILSGHMLEAIVSTVYRSGTKLIGRIFLNSSGEAIKVIGNMRHRKFFLLADRQVKDFQARMFSILRKK